MFYQIQVKVIGSSPKKYIAKCKRRSHCVVSTTTFDQIIGMKSETNKVQLYNCICQKKKKIIDLKVS
jgi:hypothetical protein